MARAVTLFWYVNRYLYQSSMLFIDNIKDSSYNRLYIKLSIRDPLILYFLLEKIFVIDIDSYNGVLCCL